MNWFKKKQSNDTYRSMWGNNGFIEINNQTDLNSFLTIQSSNKKEDTRIHKKPIEIWEKLINEKPNIDCINLNAKIEIVKQRIKVLEENTREIPKDEYEVIGYLLARKKYNKYLQLFQWPITTEEKIQDLCKTWSVELVKIEQWYTLIPDEGIQEIKKYREACNKIRPEKPLFRLIIPVKSYEEKKERRRDPILLASSPFGRWDYILGAWDKEVAIVDELIYNYK